MLERYLNKGYHFKWFKAKDDVTGAKDGSLVPHPVINAQLTYQSIDGDIFDITAPHISTLGLRPGSNVGFNWLNYKHGHTAFTPLTGDTLTGFMSGCYICTWTDNHGVRQVGHLGTVVGADTQNQAVRRVFRESMPHDVQGFNPADAFDPGVINPMTNALTKQATGLKKAQQVRPYIVALVTTGGEFYTVLAFHIIGTYEFIIGGLKRAQPIGYAQLRSKLGGAAIGVNRV